MKLAGALALGCRLALGQGFFVEWDLPRADTQPHCVVSDSRGRIWYAGSNSNTVGYFDPATGETLEARVPTPVSHPHGIAVAPGDVIWFTEEGADKIAKVDPDTLEITEYRLKNPNSGPHTPIYDGRGGVWFTQQSGNRIGRIRIDSGEIEEFEIPTRNSGPYGIIADRDGNAWFCSFGPGSNRIGRVDARTGQITEYATPTANSGPRRPWIDSKGRVWVVEFRANKLAMFDPASERFREWNAPSANSSPYGGVVDREDKVWFNEFDANTLVRFDPDTEQFTVFPLPADREQIRIVAVDPSNRIWYGNFSGGKVGVVTRGTSVVSAASLRPGAAAPGALVSIFGSRLAAGEQVASSTPLPMSLAGAAVTFGQAGAPLLFVSPGQINAQVPFDVPLGGQWMRVRQGGMTLSERVEIRAVSPAIFAAVHADTFRLVTESDPARGGEVLSVLATGLGRLTDPATSAGMPFEAAVETAVRPQVTIGGRPASVRYAGAAPGWIGLYQVNIEVPAGMPAGSHAVQIAADGISSNGVAVAVR